MKTVKTKRSNLLLPKDERLSLPLTIKLEKADYISLKQLAQDSGITISCAARMATTHGLPKVRQVLGQLARALRAARVGN